MAEWLIASYSLRQKKLVERAKVEAETNIQGKGKYREDKKRILKLSGKYINKAFKNGVEFAEFMSKRSKGKDVSGDKKISQKSLNKMYKKFNQSVLIAQEQYNLRQKEMKNTGVAVSKARREIYKREYINALLRSIQALIEDAGQEGTQNVYSKV